MTILRKYLLFLVPVETILAMSVSFQSESVFSNLSKILNPIFLVIHLIFIIYYWNYIFRLRNLKGFMAIIFVLVFLAFLQPLFSFMFSNDINDFSEFTKFSLWLTAIPISAICFKAEDDAGKLRISIIISFSLIVLNIIIANIFKIGATAYDLGIVYMGYITKEAPISTSLAILLPYFFLPYAKIGNKNSSISISTFFLTFILFITLSLVMVRASILSYIICLFLIILLLGLHESIRFKLSTAILLIFTVILLLIMTFSVAYLLKPEVFESRFRDVDIYKKTGDVGMLGSGRLGALIYFPKLHLQQSITRQFLGVSLFDHYDSKGKRYLDYDAEGPHNDYLEILLRHGYIGLLFYIIFIVKIVSISFKYYRNAKDPSKAQIAACMSGMVIQYLIFSIALMIYRVHPMITFSILLGLTLGYCSKEYDVN